MSDASSKSDNSGVVAEDIRAEFSLGARIGRFASGSVPVFAAGDGYVIKLFPGEERSFFETEKAALSRIDATLSIPTPRLIASGERGGWWYVIMTRLSGRSMAEAWPAIGTSERCKLMQQIGAGLSELHAVRTADLDPLAVDWPQFIDAQRASCRERQLAKGLPAPWVHLIDNYLARWSPNTEVQPALLHTEIMREHLLVEESQRGWQVTGLFDFEPAMLGAREYEFASAGIFLTSGEPGLLRVLLDAYGAEVDEQLPQRIMAYALLHRYSNLRWYLERLPAPETEGDLDRLARQWFNIRA